MTTADPNEELNQLLSEGEDGARARESAGCDAIISKLSDKVVLFGAGNLGRRTLAGLRKIGIQPACFLDNNSRRWGTDIEGIPVLSPSEGTPQFARDGVVLVTIWGALGSDRMEARIQGLRRLGYERVYSFVPLYWRFSEYFLPHYAIDPPHRIHQSAAEVRQAFQLMGDEASQREFVAQIRFRLFAEFQCLPDPVPGPIYFQKDLFALRHDEVFVDCGAFDGDTLALFLKQCGERFNRVAAFEPDPSNYEKLLAVVNRLPSSVREQISLFHAATGESNSTVTMNIGAGPSSQVGSGDYSVECLSLDSALGASPVTMIKMDIEGSELPTIHGAEKIIRAHQPILAISAYHRQSDLWTIPLLIHELNPSYSIYLRPHDLEGWDLVCYAIPPNRIVQTKK